MKHDPTFEDIGPVEGHKETSFFSDKKGQFVDSPVGNSQLLEDCKKTKSYTGIFKHIIGIVMNDKLYSIRVNEFTCISDKKKGDSISNGQL